MSKCKQCRQDFDKARKEQVYCSKACAGVKKGKRGKGKKTGPRKGWKYTKTVNSDGYVMVFAGNHPFANGRKMIAEHRMKMEIKLGRAMERSEVVHHKNGIKTDNRLSNLEVCQWGAHSRGHNRQLIKKRKRNANGRLA